MADDLIWSSRIASLVRGAGGEPVAAPSLAAAEAALAESDRAIVDLTARGYDPEAAVALAAAAGLPVLAIGQHDDATGRRAARAAGAALVLAYRKVAEDGPSVLARWLDTQEVAAR